MPRNRPSPGSVGLPGGNYENRSDLGVNANQTPTGLPYGEAGALQRSMAAVPLAPPPGAPAPPPPPGGPVTPPAGGPPGGGTDIARVLAAAQAMAPPGSTLFAPSSRPTEPVTAGLPSGPGPGPEALPSAGPSAVTTTYQAIAEATNSPVMRQLAQLSHQRDTDPSASVYNAPPAPPSANPFGA